MLECPFHFDNCTGYPIIPRDLAAKFKVSVISYVEGLELIAGFQRRRYAAHYFCLLHILLPGDNVIRLTPFIVSNNPHLQHILFPTHSAPVHSVQNYLVTVCPADHQPIDPNDFVQSPFDFKLQLPNGNTATFTAYVKKFNSLGAVDQAIRRSLDLRISGPVSWA